MKNKYLKPIIAIGILLVIAIIASFLFNKEVKMNKGYVNGSSAGNLYNKGMMCESNGTIFFANPNDGNKLYSMDSDGNNVKKLSDDVANFINADDNYVYYVRNNVGGEINFHFFSFHRNALCRIPRNGGEVALLDKEPCNYASLIGNYIYYLHYDKADASTLYKVRIDGKERKQLTNEGIFTCATNGQYFYYNGMTKTGSLYRFDTANDTSSVIFEGNCYQPTNISDTEFYYIDGDKDEALTYCNITTGEKRTVIDDSIDFYNIHGDVIYYQKFDGEDSGICWKNITTGTEGMIRQGDYKNLYVTENFLFFTDTRNGDVFYIRHNAPSDIHFFEPKTK